MFGPDDEEDFTPAGNSSKLASLFGTAMEEGNASLTYTAPKQPKKSRPESGTSSKDLPGKLSIIIVQAVQTYKLEGGTYINQGKLGAALLGNTASKLYQLLLYKTKQQHVTSTKITDKFQFTVQAQNFASFYDDKGQNWSIMFESETNAIDFAREVGLARACTQNEKGQQSFCVQDLKVTDGPGAEMGDLLNIRYTTLPLVNGRLEKAIESNVDAEKQRVSIRKGVWEEALVGSTKGCKKLIILPPALFGPWKPLADTSHQLVVEVEVGQIKSRRRSRESSPLDIVNRPDSSESNVDSSTDETSIKARGASISEALTNSPKTHKASIISRMARMGQATLPLKGAVVCHPSDSEETEEESSGVPSTTSAPPKSTLKPRSLSGKRTSAAPRVSSPSPAISQSKETTTSAVGGSTFTLAGPSTVSAQQMSIYQPSLGWPPQNQAAQYLMNGVPINFATAPEGQLFASPHHQVVPVPAVLPTPSGTPSSESHLSVFLSESRTHNAEVRMGLTKVADKIDTILGKVETLQQPASGGVLEPRTLLASIQKLVLENEQLQTELADKRLKMEQQNEKIYQLLQHKIMVQSSAPAIDQRQDGSLEVVMVGLQQEKTKLSSDLADAVTKINSLQIQTSNYETICVELREEIKNLTARLQAAYLELDHSKEALIEQEGLMRSLKEKTDASVNLHDTQDSVINGLHIKLKNLLAAKTVLEEALTESKQQLEHENIKISEEKTIMQSNHEEEIIRLEKKYKEQLDEAMRNNVNCSENSCHHLNDLRIIEKENEDLKSTVSDLKNQLSISVNSSMEDIKKVMNVMFKLLKSEFIPGTSYDGAAIRETMLSSIQNVTLQYMKMKAAANEKINSTQRVVVEEHKIVSKAMENSPANSKEFTDHSVKTESIKKPVDSSNINKSDSHSEHNVQSDNVKEYDEKVIDKRENDTKDCSTETKPKVVESEPEIKSSIEKTQTEQKQVTEDKLNHKDKKDESLGSNLQVVKPRESSVERGWRPQPPPSPLFDDEEDDDDWLG